MLNSESIVPVKAFKTSDGKLFTDEDDGKKYQREINFETKIRDLINSQNHTPSHEDLICEFIHENKAKLIEFFKRYS